MTCDSQREVGPYRYASALYVFCYIDDTFGTGDIKIVCFRSTDEGVTWSAQDYDAGPDAWTGDSDSAALATYQYGANIVAAYSADGGDTIAGSDNPKLAFAVFDCSSNTWGEPITTGPTIYRPGNFPIEPEGGYGNPYQQGLTVGNTIDQGQISVVRRSSGEFVFLYDSHDIVHENPGGGKYGYYYRRVSLVRYSGSWSSLYTFYDDVAFYGRDYFPGNLVLDDDGSTVHVFFASAGQPDEGAANLPWLGVMRNCHAHYSNYDASNDAISPELLTMDVDYHFGWHVIAPAARSADGLHLLYRKSDATLAVMSGSSGSWSEETIATITEGSDNSLCAGLGIVDDALYALYWNGVYTDGRTLYYAAYESGSFAAATAVFTGDENFSIEMSSTHGFDGGLGYLALMGADEYPYAFYEIPIEGVGGLARNRYRAA